MIASSRGPSEDAASSTACTTNQVITAAPNAHAAPRTTGRRRPESAPRKLAVTAAKISTASRPSRKTIIPALKTIVVLALRARDLGRVDRAGRRGGHQVDEAGERRGGSAPDEGSAGHVREP